MPKFSIIIPVYNVAPYLRECLDSVLAQTYTDWEAICVDDGSTDGSGAILDEYAARDSHFRIIHQTNAGVSVARNVALDVAHGEWVWFVDGDDLIHPEALGWSDSLFKLHPNCDSYSMGHHNLSGESAPDVWPDLPCIERVMVKDEVDDLVAFGHCRAGWGTIVRRSRLGGLRFKDYIINEDCLFFQEFLWRTGRWLVDDAPIYFYRTRSGSAVNSPTNKRKAFDYLNAEKEILGLCRSAIRDDRVKAVDIDEFLAIHQCLAFRPAKDILMNLVDDELRALRPLWLDVQGLSFSIKPISRMYKVVFWVFRIVPSISLFRWMMRYV